MGTDIHMRAEMLMPPHENAENKTPAWRMVAAVFPDRFHQRWNTEYGPFHDPYTEEPYGERNYRLFAILADVRNGGGFEPIAADRGIPEDVSEGVKRWLYGWSESYYECKHCEKQYEDTVAAGDIMGHSATWVGLRELLDFDWKGTTGTESGFVTRRGFQRILDGGDPHSWCGGVGGRGVEIVDNERMKEIIATEGIPEDDGRPFGIDKYYTHATWQVSYYHNTKDFVDNVIPLLQKLRDETPGCLDLRLVMYFDS